jgi:hypothetical protein
MRISHTFKFAFLSNPKCGSTTIRRILDKFCDVKDIPGNPPPYHPHTNALEIQNLFRKEGWKFSDYWIFTTIRNPWARMVSYYHYGRWDKDFRPFWDNRYDEKSKLSNSFQDWIVKWREWQVPNWMLNRQPLEKFCCDLDGNLLVNQIIPIEYIDIELPLLLSRLGVPFKKSVANWKQGGIKKVNKTLHKPYWTYYNKETKLIVAEIFHEDIKFGKYTFED